VLRMLYNKVARAKKVLRKNDSKVNVFSRILEQPLALTITKMEGVTSVHRYLNDPENLLMFLP